MNTGQLRLLIAALLLPAILFRGLIPPGFMPATAAAGVVRMAFCPGMGHAAPNDPTGPGEGGHHAQKCPYGATASPAPPPAITGLAARPHAPRSEVIRAGSRISVPAIVRAQSPRAPPAHG